VIEEGKEFIVFDISEENDSATAIARWGKDMARKVMDRFALLEDMAAENPGLEEFVYGGDGLELFEWEDLSGKVSESCLNEYSEMGWVVLAEKPEIENKLRLSSVEFRISRWGNFYWAMTEKHAVLPHETCCMSIKHDAKLFDFGES